MRFGGVAVGAIDCRGGAEPLGHVQAVVIEIDHDDLGRRKELGREQCGEADRPGADDCDRASRLDLAVEYAALEACRQDIAEHHQRFFVCAGGNGIQAHIGVRNADELCLGAVDGIAEDPAAGGAMRVHLLAAIDACAAGADARNQYMVAELERRDGGPTCVDDADAFMAQNPAGLARSADRL